jgi:(R,R)-butanediol dehydrogenase/meso-butanediol dehydrogenase/diacetyl reductase
MKVAVYTGPREPFRIESRPMPEPGPEELLVRIDRCGVCATDVHTWTGEAGMPVGGVYGHEFAGEVVARGDRAGDFGVGDRVTAQCVTGCGRCPACREGHLVFCPQWRHHAPGGFAQYMTIPAGEAYRLPASLDALDGALVEPLAVGLRGARLARIGPGARVLVLGAGAIGLSGAFWADRLGAERVVVAATSARRKRFALAMGAAAFVVLEGGGGAPEGEARDDEGSAARAARDAEQVTAALDGPPDVVLECAGAPGAMMRAFELVRPKGTVVGMGYGLHPEQIVTAVPLLKELRLQFSMTYDRDDYERVIATLAAGERAPRCMVTETVSLEGLTDAIQELLRGSAAGRVQCKVMVDPWA